MAGGPLFASSVYLGGASGFLFPNFYVPSTNTSNAGAFEGIGVIASLSSGSTAPAVMQFNLPETLPTGIAKIRALAMANATSGKALFTLSDGVTSPGSSPGSATMTTEAQSTVTWSTATGTTADQLIESKIALGSTIAANQILSVAVNFNSTGAWTLAAASNWQFSLIWE